MLLTNDLDDEDVTVVVELLVVLLQQEVCDSKLETSNT